MFLHNLFLIYRNFRRFKNIFFINLIGLSTGLASSLLIYLWVHNELNVDKSNERDSQLFQVLQNLKEGDDILTIEYTQYPLAKTLVQEMPEVEYATEVVPATWFNDKGIVSVGNMRLKVDAQFIGKDYFNIFSFDFSKGVKEQLLSDKYGMAISEELAEKLFQTTENVIGKTVEWNNGEIELKAGKLFTITGIFKTPGANSTMKFDLLLNYDLFLESRSFTNEWNNSDPCTFVILKNGTDVSGFNDKLAGFLKSRNKETRNTLILQRFSDRYLHGNYENGIQSGGRIEYVRLFSIIAVFILVIACINFMNLSTAKASRRLKEVGIKKAIGAGRRTLIIQHLGESMLMSFLSLFLALMITEFLLPSFNEITGKQLSLTLDSTLVLSMFCITVTTGLVSGSYPAFYLSGFSPAAVLRGKLNTSAGELWARKGLVIFQFFVSVILIVSVLVVYKQLEFIRTKNLGYVKDNLFYFDMTGRPEQSLETFLSETKKIPGVINVSDFHHNLTGNHGGYSGLKWDGKDPDQDINFGNIEAGYDFVETLGIQITQGRTFSKDARAQHELIFNETAVEQMGLKDPVGKTVSLMGDEMQIVGVAKDFNFESLYEDVKPCFLRAFPDQNNIMVRVQGGTEQETVAWVERLFHQFNPGLPFDFRFVDDDYQTLYSSEQRVAVLSRYFAGIAVLISCMGLFGLAAFTAERRLKEIAIRKILGASEVGIVYLLSGDFTKMVVTSLVVALPVSYLVTSHWLSNFAFRIDLSPGYFAAAGLLTLLIAWFTVGIQTFRAANSNPVKNLRAE